MKYLSISANGDIDMSRRVQLGKVGVIIVNYNGRKYLKGCIESISKQTYKNVCIVIVDNCSQDNSVKFLQEEYPETDLIICDENKGFAAGNNIGIKYAIREGAEYVLLLNSDTVIEPLLIEKLVQVAGDTIVAVPKIYLDKRKMLLWYAGGGMDTVNGMSYHYGWSEKKEIRNVDFACGCCVLIHRNILYKVGLFDEKYYLYFEDTDLSFRWRKKGIHVKYVPEAVMWHKIGGSGGKDGDLKYLYYVTRNHLYFIKKYQDDIQKKVYQMALEIFIKCVLNEHDKEKRKYAWWGIFDFYIGRMSRFDH